MEILVHGARGILHLNYLRLLALSWLLIVFGGDTYPTICPTATQCRATIEPQACPANSVHEQSDLEALAEYARNS